jgi:hypothetical protein
VSDDELALLRAKLNGETGRMDWPALARHFARGVVIKVEPGLDLVEVAVSLARDDKAAVEQWLATGGMARAGVEDARTWNDGHATFWAVVVAPWVLVQEIGGRVAH